MPDHERLETDELAELISLKCSIVEGLHQLARRQLTVVNSNNMTALLRLMAAKQKLLVEVRKVDGRLAPFSKQDPDSRVWRSPTDRATAARKIERFELMMEEIMHIEKECEAKVLGRRDETIARIDAVNTAANAHRAYAFTADAPLHRAADLEG